MVIDDIFLKEFMKSLENTEKKPISPEHTAISIASAAAAPSLIRLMIGAPFTKSLIPATLLMGGLGYAIPTLYNRSLTKENPNEYMVEKAKQIIAMPELSKTSGLGSALATAGKFALKGTRDILKASVAPVFKKGMPLGERALSIGSKALLGYGAYKAGAGVYNKYIRKPDYTDYLRNQIVAGNVKPEEVSTGDIESIRKISALKLPSMNVMFGGLFTGLAAKDAAKSTRTPAFQKAKDLPQAINPWNPY